MKVRLAYYNIYPRFAYTACYTSNMVDDLFEPIAVIPNITQQLIDDAVKNNPDYDREFVWIAIKQKFRDQVNARWMQVRQFCEPNFVAEFRSKGGFNSRLWELNLRYLFQSKLTRVPGKGEPDIISNDFVIECTVPDPNGVPDLVFGFSEYQYPTDEIGRRVTGALKEKLRQYNETRIGKPNARIDYASTPYIIAVGLPQREFRDAKHMSGMDIVETVLVGVGPLQVTIDWKKNTGKVSVSSRSTMQTVNGTDYGIAYFQRDEWNGVSAVLWSAEWLPEIGDVKILLNPNAAVPFDPAVLGVTPGVITYTKGKTGYTRDQKLS